MPDLTDLLNKVHNLDCFDLLARIPDGTIDAIITDLPYQVTAINWDVIIPFAPMWAEVKRVLKPRGVFVTTASQPFTSALVMSNPSWFRYEWIWWKNQATGMMNARYMPLREHESILVFSAAPSRSNQFTDHRNTYYPQGITRTAQRERQKERSTIHSGRGVRGGYYVREQTNFPRTILKFDVEVGLHPTQKPLPLLKYLVSTYTRSGDVVLDFCCGSGTSLVAAKHLGRRYIGCDTSEEYVAVARRRLSEPYTLPMFLEAEYA